MTIHHAIRTTASNLAMLAGVAFVLTASTNALGQAPAPGGIGAAISGQGTVQNGLFLQGKETYRVVDTAGFRTAADVGQSQPGTIAQVGYGQACTSCGTAACGGACGTFAGSCSTGSCGVNNYTRSFGANLANPCAPCDPYCYISVEGLYMDNDGVNNFSLSPHFFLEDFDHELGSRITIGSVSNCVRGYEVSFVGPFEWDQSRRLSGVGLLSTNLRPGDVGSIAQLSSFADFSALAPPTPLNIVVPTATEQRQRYEAEYWSLEANRTLRAGEFAKLLIGTRYINYDELYIFDSLSPVGPGQLASRTNNDLYGLQIGMDLLYPICCHGYTDFRFRAGGFVNSASHLFRLVNEGALVRASANDTTELAGLIEIGTGIRYQVGEILSLRAGTELWYLSQIASAPGQFRRTITQRTGRNTRASDDVLMTGISFGAELRY